MDSHELQNLHEAYINVYEAIGRDEMISSNIERAKAMKSSSVMPRPSTNIPKPTGQVSRPNNTFSQLDKTVRDTAGRVGEVIGRNRGRQTGIPGGGLVGGLIGRNKAQGMYDRAKETVGSFLKQDYEPDLFDIILDHLIQEGYADTNENALVIMANMSEEWKQSICEDQKRKLKDILGPGVPSEPPSSTTSLKSLAARVPSDRAKPKGSTGGISTVPLNRASYSGRKEAGRNPKYADNPDYTGPLTKGAGSGTRDRMPGTTPSSSPQLSPKGTKPITKRVPNSSNFI